MKTIVRLLAVVLFVCLFCLFPPVVLAAPLLQSTVPTIEGALHWVAAGLAGPMLSLFLERAAWFQKLDHYRKWYLIIGLNICVSLAAVALLNYVPAGTWQVVEPFWSALALMFVNLMGSQATHWVDKWSNPPSTRGAGGDAITYTDLSC